MYHKVHRPLCSILVLLSLPLSVICIPALTPRGRHDGPGWTDYGQCLTSADASLLVDVMVSVSVSFDPSYVRSIPVRDLRVVPETPTSGSSQVAPYFADDFSVQSDSINFFLGESTGVATTTNKTAFLAAAYNETITTHPPPIIVENMLMSCDEVAFRWQSQNKPYVAQGIDIIKCVYRDGHWQIQTDYSEFNSAALLVDSGLFPCPNK